MSFWCKTRAIKALGNLGKDGAVPLVTCVRNRQMEVELRRIASDALVVMGTNARPAIRGLILTLNDSEYYLAFNAAEALCKMRLEPTLIVPTLRDRLTDPHPQMRIFIAHWLRSYGPEARAAVPVLAGLLNDKNAEVRTAAMNALERIGPEDKISQ